jgi:DNA-binding NarL/FixJ family response regulator
MTTVIRVMIADDHPMFRKGLGGMLNSLPEFEVVAEAENGAEVVPLAQQHQPDVILMDVQMPELNGIEATRQILRQNPNIGILMLSMFQNDDFVFTAVGAGARGYLLKDADQEEIVRGLQVINDGGMVFSPGLADRITSWITRPKAVRPNDLLSELTEREIQVLDLIVRGYNNMEIAQHFTLSEKTVRNHVSNIFSKIQVVDRPQAIRRGREAGLGRETDERI